MQRSENHITMRSATLLVAFITCVTADEPFDSAVHDTVDVINHHKFYDLYFFAHDVDKLDAIMLSEMSAEDRVLHNALSQSDDGMQR